MALNLTLLFRRIASSIYDGFIVFAIAFFATALALSIGSDLILDHKQLFLFTYLILILGVYFIYCWRHGGTLGMLAWKLRLVSQSGQTVSLKQATIRYLTGSFCAYLLGIPLLWCLLDKEGQSIHDRLSQTKLIKC